jgi:hypothetical protein
MVYLLRYRGLADAFRPIVATGGTITTPTINGIPYRVHTFSGSGTFSLAVSDPGSEASVEYLIVAGGGGGGGGDNETRPGGGGGGAGGLLTGPTAIARTSASYTVRVGRGGDGSIDRGIQGAISSFDTIVATGGGGGGSSGDIGGQSGGNGGSGGGGGRGGPGAGIAGPPRQGHNGSGPTGQGFAWGGSGGGAGGPAPGTGGVVGPGLSLAFASETPFTYAIGGQGGLSNTNGITSPGFGNGGGGRKSQNPDFYNPGFRGTDGIVIIRYPLVGIPRV